MLGIFCGTGGPAQPGKNSDYLQQQNRSLILQLIMDNDVISRIDLAAVSGLKPATISNIVKSLLDAGLIVETELIEGRNGRKVVGLRVDDRRYCTVVVRETEGYWNLGVYELDNQCLFHDKVFVTPGLSAHQRIAQLDEQVARAIGRAGSHQVLGIGLVLPGGILTSHQDILHDKAEALCQQNGTAVYVDKSVNMAAYWNSDVPGSGHGRQDDYTYMYIQVGYSVECCVIRKRAGAGPETWDGLLSHMVVDLSGRPCECGHRGCLGQYVSVPAVLARVNALLPKYPGSALKANGTIRHVIDTYFDGDPLAVHLYAEVAEYLGLAAANLTGMFQPDLICFGDEIPIGKKAAGFAQAIGAAYSGYAAPHPWGQAKIQVLQQERDRQKDIAMQGCSRFLFDKLLPDQAAQLDKE